MQRDSHMTAFADLFRLSSARCATSTKEELLLIYSSGSTVCVERRLPAAYWVSSRRYGYSASELLPVFGRFSSGELETRLKPCLRRERRRLPVFQILRSTKLPIQRGCALSPYFSDLAKAARSQWHFSFMSHDFSKSSNLIGLPVFRTC